ncbi:MAG: Redoxin domain protein [Acidobacteria bacterium]|nr:Redoxin domain protein [Acidobacteriota bacterium]
MERKILLVGMFLTVAAVAMYVVERNRGPVPGASPGTTATSGPAPAIRGVAAPEFELADLDGGKLRNSDLQGKVLLVNFWATWCAPCEIEIPWFIDFQKKYQDDGLEVIGISLDEEGPEKVKKYVTEHKVNYKIVMGDEKTAEAFGGVIGLPTSFVVDREGKFYSMHRGLVGKDVVEEELLQLLGVPKEESQTAPASWTR